MLVHRRVTPSIKFADTHLYTWVERGTVGVKCLAQEHNTMFPARARTRTARSGVERTNHETTAPPTNALKSKMILCSAYPPSSTTMFSPKYSINSSDSCPSTSRCCTALSSNYKEEASGSVHTVSFSFLSCDMANWSKMKVTVHLKRRLASKRCTASG